MLVAIPIAVHGCGRIGFGERERSNDASSTIDAASPIDAFGQTFALGSNLRSIGTSTAVLYAMGTATITAGSTSVTFTGGAAPGLPPNVGPGDLLMLDSEVFFVQARVSPVEVTVQTAATSTHTAASFSFRRAFNSPQAWEDARQGDLVADDRIEVGVLYDDGPFVVTEALTIDGSVTDATHYVQVTVGPGQGHSGIAGMGVVFDGAQMSSGIMIRDAFTRIDGLELRGFSSETQTFTSVRIEATDVLLERLLIHDFPSTAATSYAVIILNPPATASFTLRNSMIYDGDTGARVDDSSSIGTVENCTIFKMQRSGVRLTSGQLTARNVISVDSGSSDFRDEIGGVMVQVANLSSDLTASGVTSQAASAVLVSTTPNSEDLHRLPNAAAADRGVALSFCCDIDGESRAGGAWDVGADER